MDLVPLPKARLWKNKADFFRPFRNAANEVGENIAPLYDPSEHHKTDVDGPDLRDLNTALAALVDLFPHVAPETFREMLLNVSPESRLQIVTEQILSKKARAGQVRLRPPQKANDGTSGKRRAEGLGQASALAEEDMFRGDSYKKSVKQALYQEFKALSHSSIKAVLAEQNFSYAQTRPILQQLSSRSWRFTISSLWTKRAAATSATDHPYVVWPPNAIDTTHAIPRIRRTGSAQLDAELFELFVAPVVASNRRTQLSEDQALANKLNETEAEEAEALFDCECCFSSVPFERIATCNADCHQLCFDCIRRTVSEALFGQGWARTIDLERSTVQCFAPTASGCRGVIPPGVLRRALASETEKDDLWSDLQDRAAGRSHPISLRFALRTRSSAG